MTGVTRVVLVDPRDESRQALQRLLSSLGAVWLAEVCVSYADAPRVVAETRPDLTVIALDADPEAAFQALAAIVRAESSVVVLPSSASRDGELILRAVRAGAREFLTLPAGIDELASMIERLVLPHRKNGETGQRGPHVIAITGAAGGVGCTTLAVNLATTLARRPEQQTVLVDFDFVLGAIDACLDIVPDHSVLDVAQNIDRLDLTLLKRSLIQHASGLYVLPRPLSLEDAARLDPEALRRMIGLLKASFHTVLIDTSKALQASDVVAFEMADLILVVIQLDLACLRNSARLLQLLRQYEGLADRVKVVANRTGQSDEIRLAKAEETLGASIPWQIPNATKPVRAARAKGIPLDEEVPGSYVDRAITGIASACQPFPSDDAKREKRRGLFAALF